MTPKERRARLMKRQRPDVRPAVYADIGWLWADYRLRGESEESQEQFRDDMAHQLAQYDHVYVIEDFCSRFERGRGPVGIVVATADDWVMEPHVHWLSWARRQNKLRGAVAFFMKARWSKEVGCLRVHADERNARMFRRMNKYVPLYPVGKIPGGRPSGTDYMFYMRGKKRGDH